MSVDRFISKQRLSCLALLSAMSALVISGCASTASDTGSSEVVGAASVDEGRDLVPKRESQSIDDVIASVEPKVDQSTGDDKDDQSVDDEIGRTTKSGIPIEMNAQVEQWIQFFTVKDRERFRRFLERGEKFRPMITAVLKDQNIPKEIYYQAMIESGFASAAVSHAKAVGVWQFIRGTGARYGLRMDRYVDERRDPVRATIAAALYLRDLHNVFQSWYLALAAYNAGEGRILNAIMNGKTRDFWQLVKRGALPSETMAYIPKFLAATIIGSDPERYGFDDINAEVMPTLVSVAVPSPVRLADVARFAHLPLATLRTYNPHILRGVTPPGVKSYRIWVPKDHLEELDSQKDQLAALRLTGLRVASTSDDRGGQSRALSYHKVRRGETLGGIANHYGVTTSQLRHLNGLHGDRLLAGMVLKLRTPRRSHSSSRSASHSVRQYRVRSGDSLEAIARRFGMSVTHLKRLNSLRRNRIYAGQLLKIGNQQG